jgi:hypothetical protein
MQTIADHDSRGVKGVWARQPLDKFKSRQGAEPPNKAKEAPAPKPHEQSWHAQEYSDGRRIAT